MADIDRVNLGRTSLKQTIGESAGGCTDVERDLFRDVDLEMVERAFKFQSAATNKFRDRFHGYRRISIDKLRRLRSDPRSDFDFAGHDCALRLFATGKKSVSHKKLIKTQFLHRAVAPELIFQSRPNLPPRPDAAGRFGRDCGITLGQILRRGRTPQASWERKLF